MISGNVNMARMARIEIDRFAILNFISEPPPRAVRRASSENRFETRGLQKSAGKNESNIRVRLNNASRNRLRIRSAVRREIDRIFQFLLTMYSSI